MEGRIGEEWILVSTPFTSGDRSIQHLQERLVNSPAYD